MNVRELSINAPRAAAVTVTVSAVSAQSAALAPGDYYYVCDQISYILVGSNPTATTSCVRIPADSPIRIAGIQPGEKVAVIAAGNGTAFLANI